MAGRTILHVDLDAFFAAVVLVWPILFFVPGWVVVRRVAPNLPAPGAVGVAIVTSTFRRWNSKSKHFIC